jgi:hypothetical protein
MDSVLSDASRFEDEFTSLLEARGENAGHQDSIDQYWLVHVPANRPPWTNTEIEVAHGDKLSAFCGGRAWIKQHPAAWAEAHFALWLRIGERAEMFRTHHGSLTFAAGQSGRLYLSNVFPGQWVDAYGQMANPAVLEESAGGGFTVLVVRWRIDPAQGLSELAQRPGRAARLAHEELLRLQNPAFIPKGWKYLPSLGDAGVFRRLDTPDGAVIRCQCDNDAMILQKSVESPFTPDTRVRWSWKVESLPSASAEDSRTTHDYLSLAVEFDNGQDLTYLWSVALEPEYSFRCPIATWHQRETHVVIRSGYEGLGRWVSEERDVWRDYQNAIGSPPERIVGVWLIAASIFQHGQGRCEYRDIELDTASGVNRAL